MTCPSEKELFFLHLIQKKNQQEAAWKAAGM
jgi:hypothetical protein